MDLKEYYEFIDILKKELKNKEFVGAIQIIESLKINKNVLVNINRKKAEKIVQKLNEIKLKIIRIQDGKFVYTEKWVDDVIGGITANINELISMQEPAWKIKIDNILHNFIDAGSIAYEDAYNIGKNINYIKPIKEIHYKKGVKFTILFMDGATYQIGSGKFSNYISPYDRLAIALWHFANKNFPKNKTSIEGLPEISTKHYGGANNVLSEFERELNL